MRALNSVSDQRLHTYAAVCMTKTGDAQRATPAAGAAFEQGTEVGTNKIWASASSEGACDPSHGSIRA